MPIVVLRAGSNKIRTIKNRAKELGLKYVDFVETMSIGTYEEEFELTKTKKDEELNYWALILFGGWDKITEFSLFETI
jgi:IS4 transposase